MVGYILPINCMKIVYYTLLIGLILCPFFQIAAQQEVNYTLYRYHLNLINPATTGTQGAPFVNLSLRTQWVGIEDAPETQAISIGRPHRNDRLGTGFSVINDRTFVENQTQLFLDFSYRLPLGTNRDLFLGLKAGGTSIRLHADRLETFQSNIPDPFLQSTSSFVPNFGVGVYYKTNRYFLSLSIPRLLETRRFREENGIYSQAADRPHLFLSSGYRMGLTSNWDFNPSVLFSYVEAAPFEFLLDANFTYKERLNLGAQYTRSGGIGATTSLHISDGMQLGYAYITSITDQVNQFSNGTHEMILKIKLDQNINEARAASFTTELKGDSGRRANERRVGTKND